MSRVAARLGRPRRALPLARSVVGVPSFARAESFGASLLERFEQALTRAGGTVRIASHAPELRQLIEKELDALDGQRSYSWARSQFDDFELDWLWRERGTLAVGDPGFSTRAELVQHLLSAEVGFTTARAGVAETGSLLITAAPGCPRSMSLLPAAHFAILRESQLVPRLGDALLPIFDERPRASEMPSAVHVITGPSRTSDIENDLTIGVHGPGLVAVFLLREAGD